MSQPKTPDELSTLRLQIDALDAQLLALLAQRAALVQRAWDCKRAGGIERLDPQREQEIADRLAAQAVALGLEPATVRRIFAQIIGTGRADKA